MSGKSPKPNSEELKASDKGEDNQPEAPAQPNKDNFVSVESLLSETGEEVSEERYKESNIDVGLGDFPDMTKGITKMDVDEGSSMAAKLDLAKVYIEIGDDEHAQLLLDEVLIKGDDEQKIEAKTLLDEFS